MKRTSIIVIILMLCAFAFSACTSEKQSVSIVITGGDDAQTQYKTPLGDRDTSDPNIVELLSITDAKIKEKYGIDDLENYSVSISEHVSKPQKTVRYELYLFGYHTHEQYSVTIDNNGSILNCNSANEGEYSRFLPYLTIEKLKEAEERLNNKMAEYESGSYMYLDINSGGQLCLSFETIVDIDPPNVQIYEGETITDGCNIDHRHIFESEVICEIGR